MTALRSLLPLTLLAAAFPATAAAQTRPFAQPPDWLPRYALALRLDIAGQLATAKVRVTWTNRHDRPAGEVVFNFYPRYCVPRSDVGLLAKTLELLRMSPQEGVL